MFRTANNEDIARGCLALNRRKIANLQGIETGDSFENIKNIRGSSYGSVAMEGSGRRKTREQEYATSAMMPLPTNTNLPRGVVSTLDSNRYLPIKQSGAFQTPVNVLQFYHDGGIQGAGQGEADIEKVEGGSRNVTSDLAGRMSELSGFGKPSMEKLLRRLKKRFRGGAWYDDLWDGVKSAVEFVPKAIEGFNTVKGFLGNGGVRVLDDDEIDDLVDAGEDEYKGSGVFSSMLSMLGLGKRKQGRGEEDLSEHLSRATGYGKGDMKKLLLKLRRKLKGGAWYDDLWDGVKSAVEFIPKAIDGFNTVKGFLGKGEARVLDDDEIDDLAEAGEDEYKGSGVFSSMLSMLGLGRKMGGDDYTGGRRDGGDGLAEELSRATGYGKGDMKKLLLHLRRKLKGGAWYDSLWSGIKSGYNTVTDVVPKALGLIEDNQEEFKKAAEYFNTAKDYLQPKKKAEKEKESRFTRVTPENREELYGRMKKGGKIHMGNILNGAMQLANALPKDVTDKLKSKLGEFTGDVGAEFAEALIGDGRRKRLNDNQLNALAEMGKIDYQGSGVFSSMLGMLGLGKVQGSGVLSSMLGMLGLGHEELGVKGAGVLSSMLGMLGLGQPDEENSSDEEKGGNLGLSLKSKPEYLLKKGGYSMNIKKPLPVVAPIIDLRGNIRLPQNMDSKFSPIGEEVIGGKQHKRERKKGKGPSTETTMPAEIGSGVMSKAKLRGLAVKKIMKEEGVKLGEASKLLSARIRKHGAGWFDDFTDGLKSVVGAVAPILPYVL